MKLKHEKSLSHPKRFETLNGTLKLNGIECVCISASMAKLAISYSDANHIEMYDFNTNQLKNKLALKVGDKSSNKKSLHVQAMAFSIDSERLAIGQSDCVVYVYKIGSSWGQKKSIVNKFSLQSAICALDWLSNGILLASFDGRVKLIQTQTNKISPIINLTNEVCVSMSHNLDHVVVGFLNGQIWINSLSWASNHRESSPQLVTTLSTAPLALVLTSTGYLCASGCDGRILLQGIIKSDTGHSEFIQNEANWKNVANTKQIIEYGQEISIAVSSPSGNVVVLASKQSLIVLELESRVWRQKLTVDLNGSILITSLCWSPDGTKLVACTINQSIEVFQCRWQTKLVANRFEIDYMGNRQLVIKDLREKQTTMLASNFDIQQVKIIKESFVVVWTTNSLILSSLSQNWQRSEIEWTGLTTSGIKFSFDYENVALISAVGELYLVELGQNRILGSVRTDFISPHLISVRMNERKSSCKVLAYLLDAKTIAVIDLITGLQLNTWSHSERIDWIELNETGQRMIYRDKALKLVLLLNVVGQESMVLLNNGCGFVQWVPGSDVIVAQSKDKLYVWYDYAKPIIHQVIGGQMNEALEIERSNGITKVRFTQPNTDIVLDEVLLEFDTAIDDGDLHRAETFLESLGTENNSSSSSSSSSIMSDVNSMWLTLGNLALKNLNLSVAERAFGFIGDLAKVNFIHRCQQDANILALLDSDWDRFESGQFDMVLETYLNTFNWDKAIKFAKKFARQDVVEELQQKYYQWLLDTGQNSIAAQILEQDGKLEEAIALYLKEGRLLQLTKLIVSHSNSGVQKPSISQELVEKVIQDLERTEAFEEAGDLYQLAIIDNKEAALQSYTKAKAFTKAINLARIHFPDQVVTLENQYAEYLLNEVDDAANAVNHFIEAGRTERALEAAIQARQFDRASEIASILETVPLNLGKKIAEYHASREDLEQALEMYLNISCIREAVQLLNERGQYARAFKIAKQLMSPEEAREMYEMIAKSYESDGKWREAERIYIASGDVDSAISMYKNNRQLDSMIRLVRQYHPTLLNETCIYLARELQSEHLYKQAEQYYLMASEWPQAVMMYRNAGLWEDAYRVSRANGGATAAKEIAFLWAQTETDPQESVALLNRFGLLNQVVDFALENNEFEFALSLIRNSADLKHKLLDVRLKYAAWLENEGLLSEAETMYVEANKPKEAVIMYLHRNNFQDALRVAEEHLYEGDEAEVVKDILTAQARFEFERMKQSNDFDRLDRIETLLLRAGRIEVAVRLFRDAGLWDEAAHMADQYAPHLLDSLRRDMIASNHNSFGQSGPSSASSNGQAARMINNEMSRPELLQALKTAEQNGDKESIVRYSMLLATHLLKDHQAFDSLNVLAKHSSSTLMVADSKKLLSRIAVVIFSELENNDWDKVEQEQPAHQIEMYSLLRDSFHQLLTQNSSLNQMERELFEKYMLISHYLSLKATLENIAASNGSSSAIGNVKELHLKLTVSMLRYTNLIRADKAFYQAGVACRAANRVDMAFVFFNHFLDLLDAIEEGNFNVDHSDFENTDIPYEVPLPSKVMFEESIVEEIKSWVLQTSMDQEISQTLPLDPMRDGQVYEASLINEDQSQCMPCLVTGYPVVAKHRMIPFQPDKYVANKDDWNKLLMVTKILDDPNLRQVLQFIGNLCGNSNVVKFSFQ